MTKYVATVTIIAEGETEKEARVAVSKIINDYVVTPIPTPETLAHMRLSVKAVEPDMSSLRFLDTLVRTWDPEHWWN